MSCVNEQRFGPLHLLVRESGDCNRLTTTTGWQLYELLLQICSNTVGLIYIKDTCVLIMLSVYQTGFYFQRIRISASFALGHF